MRLIDADALLDEFLRRYTEREREGNLVFLQLAKSNKIFCGYLISNAPTVDAVPVVRCKDCIHSYDDLCGLCCTCGPYVDCVVQPEFYCADGKRKRGARGVE